RGEGGPMNRRVLAGMLGLTVAGCAQTRATQSPTAQNMSHVGIQPLPSIHESINAGLRADPETRVAAVDADPSEPDPIAAAEVAGGPAPATRDGSERGS